MSTSPNANRPVVRIGAWAAVAIIVLLASSSWMVLRADIPQVSSGTWVTAGEVGAVPTGAASVSLADGRVLVSGGTSEGVPVSGIGAFEPASATWAAAGTMLVARSGHAATVLEDGRVLFAGGTAADGPSFDVEIYDPATGTSSHAGDMTLARVDAAAATLADGRVLIVGGSSEQGALALAEIFDPKTGQSAAVAAVMSTARAKASATTMLDGHVLVVGGSDGTNDLASAEIFDPAAQSFFVTGAMQTARSGQMAVLLPDNNQVLIAGGTSAGAAVASAELYADWRDGFSPAPNPMSAARSGGIAGRLAEHDLAFVGGGGATTGEYFGYATVKTDRADYWPGEFVTVTGSGWQPGETVTLTISEDADTHYDFTYTAVADASGRITNAEFAPIENEVFHHFGKKFYVAARGAASEALNTFTDGSVKISVSPATDSAATTGHLFTVDEFSTAACVGTPTGTTQVAVVAGVTTNIGGTGVSSRITAPATDDQGAAFSAWFDTNGYRASGQVVCLSDTAHGSSKITARFAGPSQIAFTNGAISALTGTCNAMGLQSQTSSGAASAPFTAIAVGLTTTSGSGAFYSNATCTAAITSTTITTGSANSPVFYYKDGVAGTPTVTADPSVSTSMAAITQVETLTAACTAPAGSASRRTVRWHRTSATR